MSTAAKVLTDAKDYWTVASRFHRHRLTSPSMGGVASRDMDRMLGDASAPVRKRIIEFTTKHRPKTQGGLPDPTGPRRA